VSLSFIVIQGRLTRDVEVRRTGSGIAVANFTVAVDRDVKGQDGNKETDFFDCVAWRHNADFVSKYFHKGSQIILAGKMQSRKWTDKDGKARTSWEVQVDNAYFCGSKQDNAQQGGYSAPAYTAPAAVGYPETMAQIERFQQGQTQQDFNYPFPGQSDYAMLEDDDAQLPF
jgi:single-strand DNA-binding protein